MAKNPLDSLDYPWEDSKPLRKALKPGKKSGALSVMSPEQFLSHANRLKDTKEDRLLINSFKDGMKKGKKFKALKLLENNMADGRHRATAALEVGIEKVPVIDYRDADLRGAVKGCHSVKVKGRKVGKKNGGALLQDKFPTHYLPNVGRQVMADGGVPSLDQIRQMMIGTAPAPASSPGAYTDSYGMKVAAPFVTSMHGGYPVPPEPPHAEEDVKPVYSGSRLGKLRGLFGFQQGGEVEGGVQFLEDDQQQSSLPAFAQPETQGITKALDVARAAEPREAELRPYEPTIREKISGFLAGTSEAKPTPERASFAKGVADILGYSPFLGQAMQAQESARAGDKKGVAMAVLPMPAGRAGAAAEEAATNIARRVTNSLGMHSEAAEVARSLPQQKGTIEQMLAMVKPKVNPEEIHWSGVQQAFQPGQKVTAEELAQHFESKLPQVQETVYGESGLNEHIPGRPYTSEFEAHHHAVEMVHRDDLADDMFGKSYNELEPHETEQVNDAINSMAVGSAQEHGVLIHPSETGGKPPRYAEYVTPGGTNYREVVLHHPPAWTPEIQEKNGMFGFTGPDGKYRDYWSRSDAEQASRSMFRQAGDFVEAHHDEPNIVGHIRMSDMTGPNGEKILNIHEFQSDWGQKARQHGVKTGREVEDVRAIEGKRADVQNQIDRMVDDVKNAVRQKMKEQAGFDDDQIEQFIDWSSPVHLAQLAGGNDLANQYMRMIEENARLYDDIKAVSARKPAAPYVTSREAQHNTPGWTDLLIKRVMQEAEKGGYDKVVWDTAAEQGARYHNMPKIVKGMQGYYGDVLPRRFKKVVPEAKIGEHEVGQTSDIYNKRRVADWLNNYGTTDMHRKYAVASNNMPDAGPEQWLKATGFEDAYLVDRAVEKGFEDPLNGIEVFQDSSGKWALYDRDESKGTFDSQKEALAAKSTLGGDKARALLATVKRPGFGVTPELLDRIRKGFSAYRHGGEVDDALRVARKLGGYVKESKRIPNHGVEATKTKHDRLMDKMEAVSKDEDKFE